MPLKLAWYPLVKIQSINYFNLHDKNFIYKFKIKSEEQRALVKTLLKAL